MPVAAVALGIAFWLWPSPPGTSTDPMDGLEAPSAGLPAAPPPVPNPAPAVTPPAPAPAALAPPLEVLADADASTDQRMAAELGRALAAEGLAPGAAPLAIVRYDALQIAPAAWRVVAPLHLQPVLALVRADSPLRNLQALRGQRINTGLLDGARAQSSLVLYRRLFGEELPLSAVTSLGRDAAMVALAQGKLDAVLLMDGQPSAWLASLPSGTAAGLRLLPLDSASDAGRRALKTYLPTEAALPGGGAPVPTLGVMSYLVATDAAASPEALAAVARGLCARLPQLQREGHAKWR
ncbi:MAG: TAXI family TRAP transporter solute-binding subunit, partial [Aquincola tertiaricarbonis]